MSSKLSCLITYISYLIIVTNPLIGEEKPFFELESVSLSSSHSGGEKIIQEVKGSLYFQREGKEPVRIQQRKGFFFEDAQHLETEDGTLLLIRWRSPARGRYLEIDILMVSESKPALKRVKIENQPKELYAGEASLTQDSSQTILELRSALHGHFYTAPYIYEIHQFALKDGKFKELGSKFSHPEDPTQYLNLGQHFLDLRKYGHAIHFYVEGLKLQASHPGYLDESVLAEVHLNLAKAYVGTGDREKARGILNLLVESYPATTFASRARRILKKMPQ